MFQVVTTLKIKVNLTVLIIFIYTLHSILFRTRIFFSDFFENKDVFHTLSVEVLHVKVNHFCGINFGNGVKIIKRLIFFVATPSLE